MSLKFPLSTSWLIGIALLAIDRIVKYFFYTSGEQTSQASVFFGFHKNKSIFFNINLNQWLVVIIMIAVLIVLIIILINKKNQSLLFTTSSILVLVGGISNLIDRIWLGYVIDYVHLINFSIFNLSDVLIILGVLGMLFFYKEKNVI